MSKAKDLTFNSENPHLILEVLQSIQSLKVIRKNISQKRKIKL